MSLGDGGLWCDVELDLFDPADFDEDQGRLLHSRNLPGGRKAHWADGYGSPEEWVGTRSRGAAVKTSVREATAEAVVLRKAVFDAALDRDKTIHDARVEAAKGAIDRARSNAEFVRNGTAGILAIYQAVLGLAFVVKDVPVHLSAVIGTTFLALAVACSTAYVALMHGDDRRRTAPKPTYSWRLYEDENVNVFTQWVNDAVKRNAGWMTSPSPAWCSGPRRCHCRSSRSRVWISTAHSRPAEFSRSA